MKLALVLVALATACGAQTIDLGQPQGKRGEVELISDAQRIPAGDTFLQLRFRVRPGLHINSHEPKDELLLPTVVKLKDTAELHVQGVEYPASKLLHLAVGAGEDMSVYTGEFRVDVKLRALAGEHALDGELRYQACDAASCFPPRSLPIHMVVNAYLDPPRTAHVPR